MPGIVLAVTEAEVARWALWGLALAAVGWGLWHFLKREPPGDATGVFSPSRR